MCPISGNKVSVGGDDHDVKIAGSLLKAVPEAFLRFIGELHLKKRLQMEYLIVGKVLGSLPGCWDERENRLLERVEKEAGEGWW